ncbi:prostaglandin-E(2) 9-reductase-like isoform X2 [Phascolarctos cinereus]|uniref:Prostaglandin-E(2) 9-reductase-like isoform X4 n=1 Tax=Phascolarctos cinereus TaxID=38626 RepID=A0A6P5LFS2_PHACI|nr:prostaglandin-E(2) 9-reductase-like isoform X4 [Phascolarctos cinereus]
MALSKSHRVTMNDGNTIPVLGLGTYAPRSVPKSEGEMATKVAIEVGFRHIDGAFLYENEKEVGQAIRAKIADGTVTRKDIFYTGKLWNTYHRPELVRPALEETLKNLQLDYIDLYIIHCPMSFKPGKDMIPFDENQKVISDSVDLRDTWEAMEKCKDAGLVKSIGVSNFNRRQLEMILNKPGLKYKPVCNQVECHPYLNQSKLLEFCKSNDIILVAYSSLGTHREAPWVDQNSPIVLEDPVLGAIAKKHNRTPAQVAIRYQIQRGLVVLAKSFTEKRIKENFQVFDFQLTPEDMKAIDGLNKNLRYLIFKQLSCSQKTVQGGGEPTS